MANHGHGLGLVVEEWKHTADRHTGLWHRIWWLKASMVCRSGDSFIPLKGVSDHGGLHLLQPSEKQTIAERDDVSIHVMYSTSLVWT